MAENQAESHPQQEMRRAYVIESIQVQQDDRRSGCLPAARGGATLTQLLFVSFVMNKTASGGVYLIGGANREAQCFGDVRRFDMESRQWALVSPHDSKVLDARSGHAAVAIGDDIYVIGGLNPLECVVYDDVHLFNTRTQQWTQPLTEGWIPDARNAHAAIALPSEDAHHRILIYGGSSPEQGTFDDVSILHIPTDDPDAPVRWERCECTGSAEVPEARELHVAAYLTPTTILFSGGRNKDGNICTDMALLDIITWQWQLIPICEWNRCSHVAGTVDGVVVSFGGFDGSAIRDDCWTYADDAESWLRVASDKTAQDEQPERKQDTEKIAERFGHCGCSVEWPATDGSASTTTKTTHGLLVFGGMNVERDLNDLVWITPV